MCRQFPGRLVLGIDARDGRVATEGWLETSDDGGDRAWPGSSPASRSRRSIYTDIATDGMMAGPNVAAMAEMQAAVDLPVVASGGVTTADDVARLAAVPMAGCIIGRALYEGTLTLARGAGRGSEANAETMRHANRNLTSQSAAELD